MMKDGAHPSLSLNGLKRSRPPRIDLLRTGDKKIIPPLLVDPQSPVLRLDNDGPAFDTLQLSDSDSSDTEAGSTRNGSSNLKIPSSKDDSLPDDISKDLAKLQQIRQSVKTNLKLRPIRSRGNLPKIDTDDIDFSAVIAKSPFANGRTNGASVNDVEPPNSATSPMSTTTSYFTPISETPYTSHFSSNSIQPPNSSSSSKVVLPAIPISAGTLHRSLQAPKRPLLIDTRPLATHQSFRLKHSINIAIPSLILKRFKKQGTALQSLDALRQYVTTEQGKTHWDSVMGPGGPWDGDVVVYDDEMNPNEKDNMGITAWAILPVIQALLTYGKIQYLEGGLSTAGHHPDLQKLVITGEDEEEIRSQEVSAFQLSVDSSAPSLPSSGGGFGNGRKPSLGLFQLDTLAATRAKKLPEIELASATSTNPPTPPFPRSPLPVMPSTTSSSSSASSSRSSGTTDRSLLAVSDATPSPPPSSIGFRRPAPPRRPSVPNLRRLDTKSAERLRDVPKLSVRTKTMRSATLAHPPPSLSLSINPPRSPTHLNLKYSNHAPSPTSGRFGGGGNPLSPTSDPANYLTPYYTPPHTPRTPKAEMPDFPPTPRTARPDMDPPTTEDAFPVFTISTILPGFLFLGPELTTSEHVDDLKALGVKRILNLAIECDDDNGLKLKEVFERYNKIPMRDTVEEDNITKGVQEVCEILDDARLHSAPTYVHCKAGKSRSVTAVMAYLIHANHWTLSKAYGFVLERRKGISPNIGFVSELMNFEEQELGGKSYGVQPTSGSIPSGSISGGSINSNFSTSSKGTMQGSNDGSSFGSAEPSYPVGTLGGGPGHHRRGGHHVRESLPGLDGMSSGAGPMSAVEPQSRVLLGDAGQEMEIKDATGRYRHARRAPVDENTLQPMRRVSKAGLESSSYAFVFGGSEPDRT